MGGRRTCWTSKACPETATATSTATRTEDILLQRLRWSRKGNEVSDRPWRDVMRILLVQGDALDRMDLQDRAERLGVADLLAQAEAAVGRA